MSGLQKQIFNRTASSFIKRTTNSTYSCFFSSFSDANNDLLKYKSKVADYEKKLVSLTKDLESQRKKYAVCGLTLFASYHSSESLLLAACLIQIQTGSTATVTAMAGSYLILNILLGHGMYQGLVKSSEIKEEHQKTTKDLTLAIAILEKTQEKIKNSDVNSNSTPSSENVSDANIKPR